MSCAACSARVEKAVNAVEGVESCAVSLLTNSMGVEGTASPEAVIAAVTGAGYGASLKGKSSASPAPADTLTDRETPKLRRRLLASLVLLLALMYVSMGHMMWHFPLPARLCENPAALGLTQLLLAAAVMVINQRFFISGFRALVSRAPNMDTLVSLGSAASFGWSTVVLFQITELAARGDLQAASESLHGLYFESAAMILTLITVGKMLEARAKGRTTDALKGLMQLAPETAVILENGKEREVPASEVQPGTVFLVRPGGRIPADGTVLEGDGAVDESALTGESIPAEKSPGNTVSAGTINSSGFLKCEARRTGADTTLSQIIRMVGDAAATKAPIAKLADRISGIFVPAVIGIALVTAAVWLLLGETAGFALARGVSVLVISCPCALGLATPVAIMVGSGVGARNGILYKTAASLEETGRIQIVVFDKTGTVTEGSPRVTDLLPAPGITETALLTAAASAEQYSEHPLAKAVTEAANARGIAPERVTDFRAMTGSGVTAKCGGDTLYGGSLKAVEELVSVPESAEKQAESLAESGKTPLLFVRDGRFLGVIGTADVIKPDSPQAIAELHDMGIETVMLTGDNPRTAAEIGRQAGIGKVIAGVMPDGKEAVIRELKQRGRVCMVGDGINDAPALTSADVGIAVGAGTDIAIDAAGVVLMNSRLSDVPAAIRLGRKTLRNIRENLFWAFCYNVIGIPLAAGVLIPFGLTLQPAFGAAAMSLSSFCVVSNALRLNLVRLRGSTEQRAEVQKSNEKGMEPTMKTVTLEIQGMMCGHCEAHMKKALEAMAGVTVTSISHEENRAVLETAADYSEADYRKVVEDTGYELTAVR